MLDDVGVRGIERRNRAVLKGPLGDVRSTDAEVERLRTRLEGVAGTELLELLVLLGGCAPDALEGNGVDAG